MAGGAPTGGSYSPLTGFVFLFNLIVGAGALTIPRAFAQVGLLYGALALTALATVSYVTATFMIEAIAGVNALKKRAHHLPAVAGAESEELYSDDCSYADDTDSSRTESVPLMDPSKGKSPGAKSPGMRSPFGTRSPFGMRAKSPGFSSFDFDLSKKMELAQMAHMLFGRRGNMAFYACTIVYLYGDLAIYAVAVPKSLREIMCPRPSADVAVWQCSDRFTSADLYRLLVVIFGLLLGPFAFGNVQKTRALQFVTTAIRHASFGFMIVLAVLGIARGQGRSVADVLAYEKPASLTTFFGVCIYSFMCHHSIPGLVAPITDKSKVGVVLASSFAAVLLVYFVLCTSATFRFQPDDIDDVYTLNFKKYPVQFFAYFLSLFPVFTLSANFPLICITLRENVRHLAHTLTGTHQSQDAAEERPASFAEFLERNVHAFVALVPPLVVAFFTEDVSMLVGFTGAYAGLGIQWVVPTCLVWSLRRRLEREGLANRAANQFASPFKHNAWLWLTFACSLVSVALITLSHSLK